MDGVLALALAHLLAGGVITIGILVGITGVLIITDLHIIIVVIITITITDLRITEETG